MSTDSVAEQVAERLTARGVAAILAVRPDRTLEVRLSDLVPACDAIVAPIAQPGSG